jgi:hypothetical protein
MTETNVELFTKGFVASLIVSGLTSIQPYSNRDRNGFQKVIELLKEEIAKIRETGSEDEDPLYRQLVRVRNRLQASNNGAFDSFETALRDLQYSFTGCPNAFYEDIEFQVSSPYALSFLKDMPYRWRQLAERARDVFVSARAQTN